MTRNTRKSLIIAAVLITGLFLSVLLIRQRRAIRYDEVELTFLLLPARENHPFVNPYEVQRSDDFMTLHQHVIERDITQPISYPSPDPQLLDYDCLTLTVVVNGDRTVNINTFGVGTLDDLKPLATKLSEILRQRVEYHVYRHGLETRTDIPIAERIQRTILVRPAESVTYGDVARLLELLKQLHADPIAVQTNHLQTWTPPCGVRAINRVATRQTQTPLVAAPSNKSSEGDESRRFWFRGSEGEQG